MRRRVARTALVLVTGLVAAVLAGCGSGPPPSPLTGLPASPDAPVLAVKIDNSPAGRPWTGVEDADVVYVEPVEGGTTRLLAVFSSQLPASVGPVRSARESDVTVLGAYGRPALAFSGSAPELAGLLGAASLVALTPQTAPDAFRRDPARAAPENLYADPAALLAAARAAGGPLATTRDIGLRFGAVPAGGEPVDHRDVRFPSAVVGVTWDPARGRWVLEPGGSPTAPATGGPPVAASTVVVQRVTTRLSALRDVAGAPSPYAVTTGAGDAEVLRDGRAFPARWARAAPTDPTTFTDPDGRPIPFAPGPVWVLLVPA